MKKIDAWKVQLVFSIKIKYEILLSVQMYCLCLKLYVEHIEIIEWEKLRIKYGKERSPTIHRMTENTDFGGDYCKNK